MKVLVHSPLLSALCFACQPVSFDSLAPVISASRPQPLCHTSHRTMQGTQQAQKRHPRTRSSTRKCKRQGDLTDQSRQHSSELQSVDYSSQPESSASAVSNIQISIPAGGEDNQLESALQCDEHNQWLSSPQDSDTSARSYQEASAFYSPVTAHSRQLPQHPLHTSQFTGPSIAEVPVDAIAETHSIASFGEWLQTFCLHPL